MSIHDDIQAESGSQALLEIQGETVVRHVGGVEDADADTSATGIFTHLERNREYGSGDTIEFTAELKVSTSVAVADRDAWTIRGQRWDVNDGAYGAEYQGGMRIIRLKRVEKIETSRANRMLR